MRPVRTVSLFDAADRSTYRCASSRLARGTFVAWRVPLMDGAPCTNAQADEDLAKALPTLEDTPNRPKTLGRVVKVLCRTKGKDAKGPLISLENRNRKMQVVQ